MARRRRRNSDNGLGILILMILAVVYAAMKAVVDFVSNNIGVFTIIGIVLAIIIITVIVVIRVINMQRENLLHEILDILHLTNIDTQLREFDDNIIVKSRQSLNNYSDLKYLKENDNFERVKSILEFRNKIRYTIYSFLQGNNYQNYNRKRLIN